MFSKQDDRDLTMLYFIIFKIVAQATRHRLKQNSKMEQNTKFQICDMRKSRTGATKYTVTEAQTTSPGLKSQSDNANVKLCRSSQLL